MHAAPTEQKAAAPEHKGDISQCPVHGGAGGQPAAAGQPVTAENGKVYNVYGIEIDPRNRMPKNPNQEPAPGQAKDLSTQRVKSTIPKGGTDETWLYPSPQMFYNALVRKNKRDGIVEEDMDVVVRIHNAMNERTWEQVRKWESDLHADDHKASGGPRLRRFIGRPDKLSPTAQLRAWLGMGFPFDRHDWYVDRGDRQVRYIIDYYYDPSKKTMTQTKVTDPAVEGEGGVNNIHIDVRPALDSVEDAVDRLRMFPSRLMEAIKVGPVRADPTNPQIPHEVTMALGNFGPPRRSDQSPQAQKKAEDEAAAAATAAASRLLLLQRRCERFTVEMKEAAARQDEMTRSSAHVGFTACLGKEVCPQETRAFLAAVEGNDGSASTGTAAEAEAAAFESLQQCVQAGMKDLVGRARDQEQDA